MWRLRVGDHRVVYSIEDDRLLVLVIKIGHRREADFSGPTSVYLATLGEDGITHLGPGVHVDWARTLEPIRPR